VELVEERKDLDYCYVFFLKYGFDWGSCWVEVGGKKIVTGRMRGQREDVSESECVAVIVMRTWRWDLEVGKLLWVIGRCK
jgi:hypothetical protein